MNIKKMTGAHYTSSELSEYMANLLFKYMKEDIKIKDEVNVLDPSCGEGDLLNAVANKFNKSNLNLFGVDIDEEALDIARNNIFNNQDMELITIKNNYIDLILDLEKNKKEDTKEIRNVDAIIANPPYVRTQNIDSNELEVWKEYFNLSGRIDLYHVFLAAMTQNLKKNDLICVITSNRYLNTSGGKSIRELLFENYEILEVIDLGDTKLFEAAVLPAIFIGRKKNLKDRTNNVASFIRIYEKEKHNNKFDYEEENIFNILESEKSGVYKIKNTEKFYKLTKGKLVIPKKYNEYWIMASDEDIKWSEQLENKSEYIFKDLFHIKVGVKTTADKVFIKKDWEELPEKIRPESDLIKSLTTSKSIKNWKINEKNNLQVLYPHKNKNKKRVAVDLEKYPKANNYLNKHYTALNSRKYLSKANRKWYEIWVPHNPDDWKKLKIVFPDISSSAQFSIDTKGNLVNGNCYWIIPKKEIDDDWLYLAAGVANSEVMKKYHSIKFQNVLYSDKKRYLTQYVNNYLLPDIENNYSKKIIYYMKKITNTNNSEKEFLEIKNEIDYLTKKAFDIN